MYFAKKKILKIFFWTGGCSLVVNHLPNMQEGLGSNPQHYKINK
jgi:hypothetical protein